jgi:hypothetical protein
MNRRNRNAIIQRLLSTALVLAVSALGGAWGVLCQSEEHVAIENVFRDCCRQHLENGGHAGDPIDEPCITCKQHTACADTPMVIVGIGVKHERLTPEYAPQAGTFSLPAIVSVHAVASAFCPAEFPPTNKTDILARTTILRI